MDRPGLGPTERRCLEEAGKEPGARGEVTVSPASWSPQHLGLGSMAMQLGGGMEIRGRKPRSEEKPRSPSRMPAGAGPPALLPQPPVPASGREGQSPGHCAPCCEDAA